MLHRLFKLSRIVHKYSGLLFSIYFLLMGISGILLNHPQLIHGISVPTQLIPASHTLVNGNRMAVREAIVDGNNIYLAGRSGVWCSTDSGQSFSRIGSGFPAASYDQDTFGLLLDSSHKRIFAGTRSGLHVYNFATERWQVVAVGAAGDEPVVDLIQIKNRLLVFTRDHCYSTSMENKNLFFSMESLRFDESDRPQSARLLHFLLKVHDGSIFGLAGRLFVDSISLALVFLCVSGLFIWLLPQRRKNLKKSRSTIFKFKWFYRNHLKVGIYAVAFISIIVLSGVLIRPPFVKTFANCKVPIWTLPMEYEGSWQPRIDKAVFEPETETLWLATRQGFFSGQPDFTQPLRKQTIPVPRSGMGTSVFESLTEQRLLIGSFSGLYQWDPRRLLVSAVPGSGHSTPDRNKRFRVTGVIMKNGVPIEVADYHRGLIPLAVSSRLQLPASVSATPMSLWHFLFEFHNGRIFQQWLRAYTWLLIPISGLLLFVNLLTGIYDWLWRDRKRDFPNLQTHKPPNQIKTKEL